MIYGTSEYFDDSVTGKCWQKCICDARFPDGSSRRIHVYADSGNQYILGWDQLSRLYDLKLEDKGGTLGIGLDLTMVLTWRDVIEVKNERELP